MYQRPSAPIGLGQSNAEFDAQNGRVLFNGGMYEIDMWNTIAQLVSLQQKRSTNMAI